MRLRQRLDCHYCGRRSKVGKREDRKFQCENCLAVNFLDENGEIDDVPTEEAVSAQHFARPVLDLSSRDDASSEPVVFCATCLKNQHLYTYALSQFLPDPDHPDYRRLEAELPLYKKGLEQRYPQCCARCEPRVRAQLSRATYNAKSDHLRRVLEKSRQRRISNRWGWRRLLVNMTGLVSFTSLAVQVCWHLYGSQVSHESFPADFHPAVCVSGRPFRSQCLDMMEPWVGIALNATLLTIWWNPKWQHKLSHAEGRLTGLQTYYWVQLALFGLRFGAWILITHVPWPRRVQAMLHAALAVAVSAIAAWSVMGIITVKPATTMNWTIGDSLLVSDAQFVPPPAATPPPSDQGAHGRGPFNVSNLAEPASTSLRPWRPATSPAEGDDSMDWTPSQPTFTPALKPVAHRSTEASPFYGTLPALNRTWNHKHQAQTPPASKTAIGLPPGFFDRRPNQSTLPPPADPSASDAIAAPKFFGHDWKADTGLESIFDAAFSINDHSIPTLPPRTPIDERATAARLAGAHSATESTDQRAMSSLAFFSGFCFCSVLAAVAVWIFELAVAPHASDLGPYIVWLSTGVPVGHFAVHLYGTGATRHKTRLVSFVLEAATLTGVALLRSPFGDLFGSLWEKLAIAAVALLLPQEFLLMTRSSATLRESTASQVSPSQSTGQVHEDPIINLVGAPETPRLQRTDSTESMASKMSVNTTSTASDWRTPAPSRPQFGSFGQTPRKEGAVTQRRERASEREPLGMDGLSLGDGSHTPMRRTKRQDLGFASSAGFDASVSSIALLRSKRAS